MASEIVEQLSGNPTHESTSFASATVRSIGRYDILRLLGRGGMGVVYLARDAVIGRMVAIKLLHAGLDSPALRARFRQEARAAGRLSHPNVVTIFHVGDDDGRPYLVMEYVEGQSLAALIRDRVPIPLGRGLLMLERICAGLACAHDAGLVHRDVKPANVIVDAAWEPRIVDFGLAKVPDAPLALTQEHALVGTLCYMSPEQLSNGPVDHRSDLFAVAALAYELVTSRRAFTGDMQQVVTRILSASPDRLFAQPGELDRELATVIARGLEHDPDRRFQSGREMAHAFAAVRRRIADDSTERSAAEPAADIAGVALTAQASASLDPALPPPAVGSWRTAVARLIVAGAIAAMLSLSWASSGGRPAAVTTTPQVEAPTAITDRPTPEPRREPAARPPASSPSTDLAVSRQARNVPEDSTTSAPVLIEHEHDAVSSPAQAPAGITVPIGTLLTVSMSTVLDSRRNSPGDEFVGALEEPLVWDGKVIAPAGAHVSGRVEQSGTSSAGRPFLELSLTGLAFGTSPLPIRTGFYRAIAPVVEGGPGFAAIIVGGAAGAAIGGAIGGRTGTVAGALLGAAGASTVREDAPSEYHFGSRLPFRLAEALHIDTPL